MKKRICSLLLAAVLMLGMLPSAFAGFENFVAQQTYTSGQFTDVSDDAWYADNVRAAYEYGLINGQSATRFAPDSSLTVAEAVKLAACLHSIYNTGSADFAASSPWYRTYVDYALQNGILIAERSDYTQPASRAVFASVLAAALPAEALTAINTIEDGAIPDVSMSASYADAVYLLYRAGVLTGSDSAGSFLPSGTIKRSEAAAIVTRMADPSLRRTFSLAVSTELTASEIYERCMPAVFKLYSYDARGNVLSMGSGVLISASGDAVTCGHIANGVQRLVAEMLDGTKREVSVYDIDTTADISHIRVVGSSLPYLETTTDVQAGDTVYALGYPGGGSAKVTAGVVTDPQNQDYLTTLIESTASVISGNSGGALVDGQGRLVGVTVSSRGSGTPSYSVPISVLETLEGSAAVSPAVYTSTHQPDASNCYEKLYPVPDFGAVTGVPLLGSAKDRGTTYFYYRLSDLSGDGTQQLLQYYAALNQNTFYQFSDGVFTSSAGYLLSVKMIETTYQGEQALGICVSGISSQPIGGLVQATDLSFAGICASCRFS